MNKTMYICTTAIGIAIYCTLSMSMRIPLGIGHIAVDLGYIALAVYAYNIGSTSAAIVGGCSAAIMSTLTGWFSLEWALANIFIGLICGRFYDKSKTKKAIIWNVFLTVIVVGIGMLVIKTAVSCWMWSIPVLVKLPKSIAAWVTDSIVMCLGIPIAMRLHTINWIFPEMDDVH